MAYWRGTTTALEHEQEWVSQTGMRERHDTVMGSVKSDQPLKIWVEQSEDTKNWDVSDEETLTADATHIINTTLVLPYWRLRIKNTATEESGDAKYLRASISTQAGGDS